MKIPEHIALSYLLAQFGVQQQYGPGGTALVIAAGCLPDLDGLTLLGGWNVYRTYHRKLGHGLPMTVGGPLLLALAGSRPFGLGPAWPLWLWLQIALLGHLATDVCFYRWPVQLLWPVTTRGWGLGLLTWNDLVPTLVLYGAAAVALGWPRLATTAAELGLTALALYLGWRSRWARPRTGWQAWLTGDWAARTSPVWRWLTGDFIT